MDIVEIKTQAKSILVGKHLIFLLCMLIYGIIVSLPMIGIIGFPMAHAVLLQYWDAVKSNKEPKPEDLIDCYNNLEVTIRFALLKLVILIFTSLWSLLLIIPGIIKGYSYSAATYIFLENPDTPIMDCISKSMELMDGHKKELFILDISFIGHFLLCIITFGLWMLYLGPYFATTRSIYFGNLLNINTYKIRDNVIDAEIIE